VADAPDPLVGTTLDERYRVERLLGKGGMGRVYDAVQVELGRRVALKVLAPELAKQPTILERFRREAIAAAMLGHPHIVDVTDFVVPEKGPPFLVMERLAGEGLMDVLQRGPLEVERAVRITVQLLDALQEAHEAGIVHRDLKPANVFLVALAGGQELVKLLDFGIAKLRDAGGRLTAVGEMVGTPRFAAPEQLKGGEVDARTDVYGAGVLLYGMLTGRPPFPGPAADLIRAVLEDEPPDVRVANPTVAPALAEVVQRAMSKSAADRYASAREMMDALGGARARGTDEDAPRESAAVVAQAAKKKKAKKPTRRAPSAAVLGGAALLAGLLLGGLAVGATMFFVMRAATRPEPVASAPPPPPGAPPLEQVAPTPAPSPAMADACGRWIDRACACPGPGGRTACDATRARIGAIPADRQELACAQALSDFACPPDALVERLRPGSTEGHLTEGARQRYRLELRGGQRIDVWMKSEVLDAYLVLRDPSGVIVATNDDAADEAAGTDAHIVYVTREAGRFELEARARDPSAGGGPFELQLQVQAAQRTATRRRRRASTLDPFRPNPPYGTGAPYPAQPRPLAQPLGPR